MHRRDLVAAAGAVLLASALPVAADGLAHVPYTAEAYAQALASGKPLLLDFYAPW